MGVVLHWFLPTNGDSRTDLSLGNAVGVAGSRPTGSPSTTRSASTSSSCPATRTWKRPIRSARA